MWVSALRRFPLALWDQFRAGSLGLPLVYSNRAPHIWFSALLCSLRILHHFRARDPHFHSALWPANCVAILVLLLKVWCKDQKPSVSPGEPVRRWFSDPIQNLLNWNLYLTRISMILTCMLRVGGVPLYHTEDCSMCCSTLRYKELSKIPCCAVYTTNGSKIKQPLKLNSN